MTSLGVLPASDGFSAWSGRSLRKVIEGTGGERPNVPKGEGKCYNFFFVSFCQDGTYVSSLKGIVNNIVPIFNIWKGSKKWLGRGPQARANATATCKIQKEMKFHEVLRCC